MNTSLEERIGEATALAQRILRHNNGTTRIFYGDKYPSGVARAGGYLFVLVEQPLNIGVIERDDELAQRKPRTHHEESCQQLGVKTDLDVFLTSIYFQNVLGYGPFLAKLFRSAAFEYNKEQEQFLVRPTDKPQLRIVPKDEEKTYGK